MAGEGSPRTSQPSRVKSSRKFTFEDSNHNGSKPLSMSMMSTAASSASSAPAPLATGPSSPIATENVISPSKMKRQSRKNGKNIKSPTAPSPRSPVSKSSRREHRESRDDSNTSKPPSTSTRSSSSRTSASRKSSSRSDSDRSSSSSRPSNNPRSPRSPRSSNPRSPRSATSPRSPRSSSGKKILVPKSNPDKENNKTNDGRSSGRSKEKVAFKEEKVKEHQPPPSAKTASAIASAAAATLLPAADEEARRTNLQRKLLTNLRAPDPALADLLSVLTDFEETSHLRRVNACGAIKTLTLHKANQIPLARTRGVVPSLTSVLCAVNATEEERTRCINALMHLCVPEENWKLVYLFPQTPEALARNMADKYPQIRYAACLATSFLAKKNRREVIKNRLLMYAMARVLEVDKNGALDRMSGQDKKVFVGARVCVLKMLLHLSKNKDVSNTLARTECVTSSLVSVANTMQLAANILCIAILTNLTRHPDNAYYLVYKVPDLVATFVSHVECADAECAKCALYALQNLSCTGNCRQELANTPDLLGNVTKAAFRHDQVEQQLSALHTLKNLSDDPFNLVTMTNTPGCTATLLALANNDAAAGAGKVDNKNGDDNKKSLSEVGNKNAMAQYLACDTLATLSHWLLTLSATRKSKDGSGGIDMGRRTFKQNTWEAWH